jgi:hypothetical protein
MLFQRTWNASGWGMRRKVGDLYSKLKDDVAFQQEWAERIGLGLSWSTLVHKTSQERKQRK